MVSSGHAHPLVIGFKFGFDQTQNIRFAVFRDPWDRAVSMLEYGNDNSKDTRLGWTKEPLYVTDKVAMMQRFLEQILEEKQDPQWRDIYNARQQMTMLKGFKITEDLDEAFRAHVDDISDWSDKGHRGMYIWKIINDAGVGFNVEGDWVVDVVLRFSHIQEDLDAFRSMIGLHPVTMPGGGGSDRQETKYYFDQYNDQLLRALFPDDIEFGKRLHVSL